ncbi:uncharacterized protein MELLADRAFT_91911 [Melampsora larici-populina 98AG31]|uniref:Uncharacterized protein n=1 Tax=Melampsora larici-populina (strain 98AG31 / pathotype 3-4-7) TaxID=747676 RepID=F4S0U2_MELLP|nr:uncharacterized protein MELLADRAFT_91911 [Melampsora larici-populina 98AG31]EGG01646.1 hypothetical protein MELLADRAFT_91911 [Melampsora larici-populina 98AG31]
MVTFLEELAESRKRAEEAVRNGESGPRLRSRSRTRNEVNNQSQEREEAEEVLEEFIVEEELECRNEEDIKFVENYHENPSGTTAETTNTGTSAGLICPFGPVRMEKESTEASSELSEEEENGEKGTTNVRPPSQIHTPNPRSTVVRVQQNHPAKPRHTRAMSDTLKYHAQLLRNNTTSVFYSSNRGYHKEECQIPVRDKNKNPILIRITRGNFFADTHLESKNRWWGAIVDTFNRNKVMLRRTMLAAFEAMYGHIPFDPESESDRGRQKTRSQPQVEKNRPRTASLIVDDEPRQRQKEPNRSPATVEIRPPVQRSAVCEPIQSQPNPRPVMPEVMKSKGKSTSKEEEDTGNPEEDITFVDDQQLPNNSLLKLSHCFHQRMTKLKSFVPLTVFNMDWIDRDSEKASQKKVKTVKELQEGDDTMTYSGLVPKDELLLNYGDWLDHMDLFIRYVDEYYNMPRCAKNFRKHKLNVIEIQRSTSCWMVALRYCIKVRKLVMQFRQKDGKRVMSNARILHKDILRAAKDKAEAMGERSQTENPYVTSSETPDLLGSRERSLIKREFAAANQNGGSSGGNWRGNSYEGGKRGNKFQKNVSHQNNQRGNVRGGNQPYSGAGSQYGRGLHNLPYHPLNNQYNRQPSFHYQPYAYSSHGAQSFNHGNAVAGPSESGNQVAIVPKTGTSGPSNQSGALAIVQRNNANKHQW